MSDCGHEWNVIGSSSGGPVGLDGAYSLSMCTACGVVYAECFEHGIVRYGHRDGQWRDEEPPCQPICYPAVRGSIDYAAKCPTCQKGMGIYGTCQFCEDNAKLKQRVRELEEDVRASSKLYRELKGKFKELEHLLDRFKKQRVIDEMRFTELEQRMDEDPPQNS